MRIIWVQEDFEGLRACLYSALVSENLGVKSGGLWLSWRYPPEFCDSRMFSHERFVSFKMDLHGWLVLLEKCYANGPRALYR